MDPSDVLVECLGHLSVGLRQRLILRLEFREQPHVVDGDDGLVGERLDEGDPPLGNLSGVSIIIDDDNANTHSGDERGPAAQTHTSRSLLGLGPWSSTAMRRLCVHTLCFALWELSDVRPRSQLIRLAAATRPHKVTDSDTLPAL
jgi:hypothetical protein